jgi:hypothetical protein
MSIADTQTTVPAVGPLTVGDTVTFTTASRWGSQPSRLGTIVEIVENRGTWVIVECEGKRVSTRPSRVSAV